MNARLCQIINDHHSTISELARGIGVPRITINRWIKGDRDPLVSNMVKISKFWPDVDLHYLLTGELFNDYKRRNFKGND